MSVAPTTLPSTASGQTVVVTGTNFATGCIASVGGVEVYGANDPAPIDLSPDAMEPLWECGLGPYLLAAALHLTSLDPKKALRSGVRPLPT